eukprot:scaffold215705_cov20-Tisochrysis_lutea.AAC.1
MQPAACRWPAQHWQQSLPPPAAIGSEVPRIRMGRSCRESLLASRPGKQNAGLRQHTHIVMHIQNAQEALRGVSMKKEQSNVEMHARC